MSRSEFANTTREVGPQIHGMFKELLGCVASHYDRLAAQVDCAEADALPLITEGMSRATQLIEVLESITYDRIAWLTDLESYA